MFLICPKTEMSIVTYITKVCYFLPVRCDTSYDIFSLFISVADSISYEIFSK